MNIGISFKNALVKSGAKAVNEAFPEIVLTSSYNGFRINKKAGKLLGVTNGDKVVMFDAKHNGATGQEDRYYLAVGGFEIDGKEQGATIGKGPLTFNYSSIYGTILNEDFSVDSIGADELEKAGLLEKREGTTKKGDKYTSYVATKTASFELVAINEGEPVEIVEDVELVLYQLTNGKFEEHNPKVMTRRGDSDDEEDSEQEDSEQEEDEA